MPPAIDLIVKYDCYKADKQTDRKMPKKSPRASPTLHNESDAVKRGYLFHMRVGVGCFEDLCHFFNLSVISWPNLPYVGRYVPLRFYGKAEHSAAPSVSWEIDPDLEAGDPISEIKVVITGFEPFVKKGMVYVIVLMIINHNMDNFRLHY